MRDGRQPRELNRARQRRTDVMQFTNAARAGQGDEVVAQLIIRALAIHLATENHHSGQTLRPWYKRFRLAHVGQHGHHGNGSAKYVGQPFRIDLIRSPTRICQSCECGRNRALRGGIPERFSPRPTHGK